MARDRDLEHDKQLKLIINELNSEVGGVTERSVGAFGQRADLGDNDAHRQRP